MFTCPVCNETLGEAGCPVDFVPCTLSPCGHILCLQCAQHWQRDICPQCRRTIERVVPMVQLVNDKPEAVAAAAAYQTAEPLPPPPSLVARRGEQMLRQASPSPREEAQRILVDKRTADGRYVIY